MKSNLPLAPADVAEECQRKSRAWYSSTKAPFNDCGMCARGAVAEFLANEQGYTLYKSVADLGEK